MRRLLACVLIASAAALLATPATAQGSATTSCSGSGGIKPLIRGLVDRKASPPGQNLQATAIVVNWDALEPTGPGLASASIDSAIALAACAPIRLRVLAGIHAPAWVKSHSGGAVNVTNPFDGTTGTIGRFWTAEFQQDYDNLQAELAARYDATPNLDEVVVSRCTMFYAEPLIRYAFNTTNITNLRAAGYTLAADRQCQTQEIDSAAAHWSATRFSVAFNPYQVIPASGPSSVDESFTEQLMAYCRYIGGQRCVLENDSIRDPIGSLTPQPQYTDMYNRLTGASGPILLTLDGLSVNVALGPPIAFQTATSVPDNIGDFWGTLVWARQHHAASVELPVDGTFATTGPLPWQNLPEVALWFQEDPAVTSSPLNFVEGASTSGASLGTLTLDELAAVDTAAGYGDVGAVPFDTVSATVHWPDGVTEPATAGPCPLQRWCQLTIGSGGHVFAEESAAAPVSVDDSLGYVPADGLPVTITSQLTVADAVMAIVGLHVIRHFDHRVTLALGFTDADPAATAADYTVTIQWGDGSTSVVPASAMTGAFVAMARHRYSAAGTYQAFALASDSGGASVEASASVTVR